MVRTVAALSSVVLHTHLPAQKAEEFGDHRQEDEEEADAQEEAEEAKSAVHPPMRESR